jgi:hypothetical protein
MVGPDCFRLYLEMANEREEAFFSLMHLAIYFFVFCDVQRKMRLQIRSDLGQPQVKEP